MIGDGSFQLTAQEVSTMVRYGVKPLAGHVRDTMAGDASGVRRPILAVVDVESQAHGRLEALLAIHLSLAAAVDAYVAPAWPDTRSSH